MKRYFLFVLAAGLTLPAAAQTERGAKLIGISVGELSYQRRDANNTSLSAALYPSAGWFVADKLVIGSGVQLLYNRQRSQRPSSMIPARFRSRTLGVGLAPFVRYYFLGQRKHRVFAHAGVNTTWYFDRSVSTDYQTGQENPPRSGRSNQGGLNLALGYNYFLAPTAALELTAGYRRSDESEYFYRLGGSLDVRLGLSVFLPSGKALTE